MGSWRNEYADSLQKVLVNTVAGEIECVAASYDGIPFFIEETESSGGREIVTSPLPFSDMHVNEDVGKKVRSFTFSIYLVGINCNVDREKLEEAFNKDGYFELSHPYYGKFNVRCAEYRFKYSSSVLEALWTCAVRLYRNQTLLSILPKAILSKSLAFWARRNL